MQIDIASQYISTLSLETLEVRDEFISRAHKNRRNITMYTPLLLCHAEPVEVQSRYLRTVQNSKPSHCH
jgi:hypothetical protein